MEQVLYILVNSDIKIAKGKLAGQVGHAVDVFYYHFYEQTERISSPTYTGVTRANIQAYHQTGIKKIILKCDEATLLQLESAGYLAIRDRGLTHLAPNTLTCVCAGLFEKGSAPEWIQQLKLY